MSSDKHCCVPGCTETKEGRKVVLHGFPNPDKDRHLFNTWLYAIGGEILGLELERVFKYRRVCHSHFEDKYLMANNRITKSAVPRLNMPDVLSKFKYSPLTNRKPMQSIMDVNASTSSQDVFSEERHVMVSVAYTNKTKFDTLKENVDPELSEKSAPHSVNEIKFQQSQDAEIPEIVPTTLTDEQGQQREDSDIPVTVPTTITQEPGQQCKGNSNEVTKKTRRLYLSNTERELHSKIVAAKIKICKMKNKMSKQIAELKSAKKMMKDPSMLQAFENCSSTAKLLIQIQCRENKKKEKGRRFTLKEKIIALSMLKQSPKGYRFFRKVFILPAPQTLIKLIQRSCIKPGINKNVFSQLKKKCETMTVTEKLCVLLFDEVSIKASLTYQQRKDKVAGFVDNGKTREPEFADHAQVFMVRGLINNYKQAVAYTFSSSATKGPELSTQIKEVVTQLQNAGLTVVATICDQGTNNRHAIRLLLDETRGVYLRRGEDPKDNIILINNEEIFPLYDPPHLLKGVRNNLLTKDMIYVKDGKTKVAKWSHLEILQKENPGYKGIRMIPKLTENHVNRDKINKMRVKFASQIFSRTVAANMGYLAAKNVVPTECEDTADFLLLMDNLFDSVNGSFRKNRHAKPLLGPATPKSVHWKTWSQIKLVLKSIKFVTPSGKQESVPSIINWVWTLNGLEFLLKKLQTKYGITSVWLRHLNQDPLENFFGSIRSHGCRNVNPTCDQFESAFGTLLINNLNSVHTPRGKNCEGDYCEALHALIVDDNNTEPPSTHSINFDNILEIEFTDIEEKEKVPSIIAPLQYVSGYFLKKAKTNIFKACPTCKEDFTSSDEIEYIKFREYAGKRWLCTPSKELVILISQMQDVINFILKEKFDKEYLYEIIKTSILILIDFNFINCSNHKKKLIDFLIKCVSRLFILVYCKTINKILTGRDSIDDDEDGFQMKALKYNKKCYKRKLK